VGVVRFSLDSRWLLARSKDEKVCLWSADTGMEHDPFLAQGIRWWEDQGWFDAEPLKLETVVRQTDLPSCPEEAWYPLPLQRLTTHSGGHSWAGAANKHLYLLRLESETKES
jgi:hypothetical protein